MSRRWRCVILVATLAACVSPPDAPIDHRSFEDVRRIVVALDDVRDEYHLAVAENRAVVDDVKLRILQAAMHDSLLESHRFPLHERAVLRRLAAAVSAHASPADVARNADAMRRYLLRSRRLVLAPPAPPPFARVDELWRMQCSGCHGAHGAGDGLQGLDLDPGPKTFQDEEVIAHLAPTRAFSRLADGLRGTAMPSWGYLTSEERWGLAFLVLTFRHDDAAVARGRAVAARRALTISPTWLADRTDDDLGRDLVARGLTPADAADVVAFARVEAAFAPTAGPSASVRALLAAAVTAYRARRFDEARRLVDEARAAMQPVVARVRPADRATAARLELCSQHLVAVTARLPLLEIVEREVARCQTWLDRGDRASARGAPSWSSAVLALERAGFAAIALGLLAALWWRRRRLPRLVERLGALSAALGAAALVGRLAWNHWLATSLDLEALPLPRIEAIGLYPSASAVAAALVAAIVAAAAWRFAVRALGSYRSPTA